MMCHASHRDARLDAAGERETGVGCVHFEPESRNMRRYAGRGTRRGPGTEGTYLAANLSNSRLVQVALFLL